MHRIMADLMSKDFEIVTRPSEENYRMKIPEGNAANEGRLGVQGCFDRIYHPFELTLKTVTSSQIARICDNDWPNSYLTAIEYGAKFTIEPSELTDYAGTDVVDALNPLGAEQYQSMGRYRFIRAALVDGGNYYRLHHPRVIPLKLANDLDDEYNYVAMAVWTETNSTTNNIWFSIMANKRRDASTPDVTWPYLWREPTSVTLTAVLNVTSTNTSDIYKVADICEFDDGSIFLILAVYNAAGSYSYLYCFRSFDYGVTWNFCGTINRSLGISGIYEHSIALARVNERLVIAYYTAKDDGADTDLVVATYFSDDFGLTWTAGDDVYTESIAGVRNVEDHPCVDIVRGRDGVLYLGYNDMSGADNAAVKFSRSLDGSNWSAGVTANSAAAGSFGFFETSTGCWVLYFRRTSGAASDGYELSVYATNEAPDSGTTYWNDDVVLLTNNSIAANVHWDYLAACLIENEMFASVLVNMYDTTSNSAFKSTLGEMKCAMWSGLTDPSYWASNADIIWDNVWVANCYPSTSDSEPNIHQTTRTIAGDGASVLTNDTAANRSYLRMTRTVGANSIIYSVPAVDKKAEGGELRCSFRMNTAQGEAVIGIQTSEGVGDGIDVRIIFDLTAGTIVLYDTYKGGGAGVIATCTPTNWSLDEWNVFHVIWQNDNIYVYRSSDQFAELLNMELILSSESLGIGAIPASEIIFWGTINTVGYDHTSSVDYEFVMINTTGTQWATLPVDQDADLIGRRCYYYPSGLYGGMGAKFDGTHSISGDEWDVETGAIYEVENIFEPSPSVIWKSAATVSDPLGTEPNEIITWKQKDSGGQMHQTATGFAVFGRNWPYCKLEGSEDGAAFTTIFDSLTTGTLAYAIHLEANGASHYNQVIASLPAAMPALHTNRYASTPEISWYLMAIEGPEKYRIYRILENDADRFYLDQQMAVGMANGNDFVVFSDRFYYDWSVRATESSLWGDTYGSTAYNPSQYRYFRLTIYGNSGGTNLIFPDADDGLKKLGSIHLGRVYDLPNEEWGISVAHQPAMAVTEARSGRKEYRRVGVAKRVIGLSYTGIVERGLGVNPVVDLNRSLGWGEHPLVFLDDADTLQYGDSTGYGNYTHPGPVLCRMVNGYQLSRAAYSYESEHQGDEAMNLTRGIVDISGIQLEEVI